LESRHVWKKAAARGDVYTAGDVDCAFTIQSVSKPFTAALVMQERGSADVIRDKIGVEWAYTAGLPAKTGVGGGIVAVVPGRMAIVGFSPRVNEAGNSVRAMKAIEYISDQLGVNIFGSGR
jgi:glutaminase